MSFLKQVKKLPKNPSALMALELAVIYASLQGAMPAALAIYPQVTIYICTYIYIYVYK
jgi:hypothetical protein